MMRPLNLVLLALASSLVACGEESYCDRVDCDEASTSTSTTLASASSGTDDTSSSTSGGTGAGGSGDGGGGEGGAGTGGGGSGPFEVTPSDSKVGILRSLDFDASVDVEWSVVEDDGGSIDGEGVYVSPETPGTFHVVATSSDSGDEIEVEVTVVGLALEIAGGMPGGAGNIDGIASRARFASPRGLGVVGTSDFVIADTGNHTLRLYRESDGSVTTLAGSSGVPGITNGVGSAARFNAPMGVVVEDDVAYVVDGGGTCIRRVEVESGGTTTLAGACGTSAYANAASGTASRFVHIESIELSPDGDGLYVCDPNTNGSTNVLRRVDATSGATIEWTIEGISVGTGCALTPDPDAQLTYLHTGTDPSILSNAPGSITALDLVEGPGADARISALAYQRVHETLFALDRERPGGSGTPYETTLHAFELGDDAFVEVAGGDNDYVDGPLASARFLTPGFLVPASNGDLLFSDIEAHTIRRIGFSGADEVETVLGSPATIYARDGSASTGRLLFPIHLALAQDDDAIFVAGMLPDNVIRRIDAQTRAITKLSGVPADYVVGSEIDFDLPADGQADVAVFGAILDVLRVDDDLYVIDTSSAVRHVDIATGAVDTIAGALNQGGFDDGVGAAARFDFSSESFAGGLATDGVDLFVADPGNFAIRRVELATGEVTTIAGGTEGTADGTGDEAQFVAPAGLAYDDGTLYVADVGAHTIRAIDVATGDVTTLTGRANLPGDADGDADGARFAGPYKLAADGLGNLYVTSTGVGDALPHTIRRIRLADVETSTFAGDDILYGFGDGPLPATLGCPLGMAIDGVGDLVFSDACDGAIGAIRPL
jgi:hypothetical protein